MRNPSGILLTLVHGIVVANVYFYHTEFFMIHCALHYLRCESLPFEFMNPFLKFFHAVVHVCI